jgi:hypothetical protein
MEAKLIRYEAEAISNAVGQIAIIATKEEWINILMDLRHGRDWYELEPESEELIEKLNGWNL